MPKAIIIGGGIGGLAAAIALKRIGHEIAVYEQAQELKEVGAGISIWANGLQVLETLGLDYRVSNSLPITKTLIRTHSGQVLSEFSKDELPELQGDFMRMFHRAELLDLLRSALPNDDVHLGKRCRGAIELPDAIEAVFDDGYRVRADYLIGADGIHSCIRTQLFGEAELRYSGYTTWRSVVSYAEAFIPGETWGRGDRFGAFPLAKGRAYWFAVNTTGSGGHSPVGEKAFLSDHFKHWHDPISALIEAADEIDILRNDIFDRPPVIAWGRGRVTLLGDAAHPMTPNMGQGACQALEDALVLGQTMNEINDVRQALRHYESRRMKRANGFVRDSFRFGRIAQARSAPAAWLRNLFVRNTPTPIRILQVKKMISGPS